MKILLLGANGQLGQAFQELALSAAFPIGWECIAWDRMTGNLGDLEPLKSRIETLSPNVILNCAAYTKVDLAETEADACEKINAEAPAMLAAYARDHQRVLVHFSTDYVYEGVGTAMHVETERLHPQNQYGRSKALGDEAIILSGCEHLIFRTAWVYSHIGNNFVRTMRRLGETKTEIKVVGDQVGSPTYAPDLAEFTLDALMQALEIRAGGEAFPSGVYHLTNAGFTTWADFAKVILPRVSIVPIPTQEYPTAAKRPLNSRLSLEKLRSTFHLEPRPWQEALRACLKRLEDA